MLTYPDSSTEAQLGDIDGMLYVPPVPESFDPATGNGAFTFPGYLFTREIHFFDVNGRYWAGGRAKACSADGTDCRPAARITTLDGYPVSYQYVLELVGGHVGGRPAGNTLDDIAPRSRPRCRPPGHVRGAALIDHAGQPGDPR